MSEALNANGAANNNARTAEAYRFCREVARREAQNFYWAFRVLPRHKSDAMCAVYAFMRRADDISDDESKPLDTRRAEMTAWLHAWRASHTPASPDSLHDANADDPVFIALADTQRRFDIPDRLLEELIAGTTMDLVPRCCRCPDLRYLRRSLSLLLPRSLGRRPGLHPNLRLH